MSAMNNDNKNEAKKRSILLVTAVTLHNIPEGLEFIPTQDFVTREEIISYKDSADIINETLKLLNYY